MNTRFSDRTRNSIPDIAFLSIFRLQKNLPERQKFLLTESQGDRAPCLHASQKIWKTKMVFLLHFSYSVLARFRGFSRNSLIKIWYLIRENKGLLFVYLCDLRGQKFCIFWNDISMDSASSAEWWKTKKKYVTPDPDQESTDGAVKKEILRFTQDDATCATASLWALAKNLITLVEEGWGD